MVSSNAHGQCAEPVHDHIEEGAEDARTCELELSPQFPVRLPPCVFDRTVLADPCSPEMATVDTDRWVGALPRATLRC
jgi:hypothetical protein